MHSLLPVACVAGGLGGLVGQWPVWLVVWSVGLGGRFGWPGWPVACVAGGLGGVVGLACGRVACVAGRFGAAGRVACVAGGLAWLASVESGLLIQRGEQTKTRTRRTRLTMQLSKDIWSASSKHPA